MKHEITKQMVEDANLSPMNRLIFETLNDQNDPDGGGRLFILTGPERALMNFLDSEVEHGHLNTAEDVASAVGTILMIFVEQVRKMQKAANASNEGETEIDPNGE